MLIARRGGHGRHLVGTAVDAAVAMAQRELIKTFPRWGGILAGQAAAAEVAGVQADAAGHSLQRQVEQRIGPQFSGHSVLLGLRESAALHGARRAPLAARGPV